MSAPSVPYASCRPHTLSRSAWHGLPPSPVPYSRLFFLLSSLCFLLFLFPVHADSFGSHSGWGERVEARVLDANDHPIPGAEAYIRWPINSQQMGTTKTQLTNEFGRTYFQIDSYEYIPTKQNYNFTIYASYAGVNHSALFDHRVGTGPRTVWLDIYKITFLATDQNGKPLSMGISADHVINTTSDSDGWAQMRMARGTHTIYANYGSTEQSRQIVVLNDSTISLGLHLYSLRVRVLDDQGNPLDAQLSAGSDIYTTDRDGYVGLYNLTSGLLPITVYYGSYKKEMNVNLDLFNQTLVVFDSHSPKISNPNGIYNGSTLRVSAAISDPGDYASGLSEKLASITLQYLLPGENKPKTIPMYATGYNLFEASIPLTVGTGDVRYTIIATDADGNTAQSTDVFNLAIDKPAVKPNTPLSPTPTRPDLLGQFGWLFLLLGLVIIGGGYWYYISRRPPSGIKGATTEYHFTGQEGEAKKPGFNLPIKFNRPRPPPPVG